MKEVYKKKLIGINAHSKSNNRRSLACSYGFNLFYSINVRKYYIYLKIYCKKGEKNISILYFKIASIRLTCFTFSFLFSVYCIR